MDSFDPHPSTIRHYHCHSLSPSSSRWGMEQLDELPRVPPWRLASIRIGIHTQPPHLYSSFTCLLHAALPATGLYLSKPHAPPDETRLASLALCLHSPGTQWVYTELHSVFFCLLPYVFIFCLHWSVHFLNRSILSTRFMALAVRWWA